MTNCTDNANTQEQIKNKNVVPDDFYRQLEGILEQDEFNVFKTKSKKILGSKIRFTDLKIQKLLDLKLRSGDEIKKLATSKKNLKTTNLKLKESIIKQLDLEVA